MAIFSNKIINAYYTDSSLSNVTILYNYEKDGETLVGEYRLLVDETEEQFKDLMKEVTYQDIEINTMALHEKYNKQMIEIINDESKRIARREVREEFFGLDDGDFETIFQYDSSKHADELFKCKMYLFSLDIIKNGHKTFRAKIRKAENILELCKLLSTEKRRIERKESK